MLAFLAQLYITFVNILDKNLAIKYILYSTIMLF